MLEQRHCQRFSVIERTLMKLFLNILIQLKKTNPGTITQLDSCCVGMARFCHVFWVLGHPIKGFTYCRPLWSIDSTHLFEKYKGCLLIATRVETHGGLYLLAYVSRRRWNRRNLDMALVLYLLLCTECASRIITFIFDYMKGLPNALKNSWPAPRCHHYCLRYIRANFKTKNF